MRRTLYTTSLQHAVEAKSCTSIPDSSPTEAIAADGTRNFALPPGLTANGQIHAGAQRVISAPGKGALKTLGMDVNQTQHDKEASHIVSLYKFYIHTHGGCGAHGGGTFSGEGPSKLDTYATYI